MKTEAETGGRRPQAQGRPEPPEAGRGGKDPPLESLEGARPWDALTSDVWSPGWGRMDACGFKLTVCGSPRKLIHLPERIAELISTWLYSLVHEAVSPNPWRWRTPGYMYFPRASSSHTACGCG